MRKIFLFVAILFASFTWGTQVFLKPNSNWLQKDGGDVDPRFAVFYFKESNPSDQGWISMAQVSGYSTKFFQADIPSGYDKCIFCRMNGANSVNDWSNKYNQTGNLTVPTGDAIYYSVPNGEYDWDAGTDDDWSEKPFEVSVGGTWLRFTGETIILNATCAGATNFQWYKGGTDESNIIPGAINATYTKTNCTFEDGGHYYCKAWRDVDHKEVNSSPHDVRVPYLNIKTGRHGSDADLQRIALIRADEAAEIASGSLLLGLGWDYGFFISDGIDNHGQNNGDYYLDDKLNSNNCTDWDRWVMNDSYNRCVMRTTKQGTYTFTIKFSKDSWTPIKVNVEYPPMVQTAGRPIYIEKTPELVAYGWNKFYYRIGKGNQSDGDDENWTSAYEMTLVPGTERYYQSVTPGWGNDFWAWHIANNTGDANSVNDIPNSDPKSSIYKTNSGATSKEITRSINFSGDEIRDPGWTIYPTVPAGDVNNWGKDGKNNHCRFLSYTQSDGMITHDASVAATTNGKIKITYTHHDNTAQTSEAYTARALNGLAHTCNLTITAVPDNGYCCTSLQVNGVDFTSGTVHVLDADATITATFDHASYTVELVTYGGTINSGNVTGYTHGIGATLPTDVTLPGRVFTGWYEDSGCTGTPITEISTTDYGNKKFYAGWERPFPVFTWTYDNAVKAGGIYPVSVATDGEADVTLSIIEAPITGITPTFTAGKPATGTVAIGSYLLTTTFTYQAHSPETANFKEKTETKTVTITICETAHDMNYEGTYTNTGSSTPRPQYFTETSGVGRIMKGKGGSSYSTTGDGGMFSSVGWTRSVKNQDHEIQTYKDNIVKVVLYVKCTDNGGNISKLRRSASHINSESEGEDILPSTSKSTIIYNDVPTQTEITKNAYETITIIPATPLDANDYLYVKFNKSSTYVWGVKLYRAEGDEVTTVAFSCATEIEKYPGDAAFTETATQTTTPIKSGGSITYKSSDETVATVDKNTGEVTPLSIGRTTITATLSAFGCFKAATASYSLVVKKCIDPVCTIAVTAGKANKCSSDPVILTATAAAGAAIQWYKDGVALVGETNPTLTTTDGGDYHATAVKECLQVSNTITVQNFSAPTATALHDYYYIRAGRTTPDIALFQLTNVDVSDPTTAFEMNRPAPDGCAYELRGDGIVYLTGTPATSLTVDDYEIEVTAKNPCSLVKATANMHIHQIVQGKIAWVGCGDKGGADPTENAIPASQGTNHVLYKYLKDYFELVPVNAYWTINEDSIKDYYSQFDLVLLTDYPDTNVKPDGASGGKEKSYSNAIGCLIDEKPILTFEAFVADCPNWDINSNPKTPDPKQKDMTLLCSAHKIFEHTTITDDVVEFLTTTSDAGNALQGFTGTDAPAGMIFIATIADPDGTGGNLIVCCERQKVIEARMMIMGLNHDAMGKVSDDGKTIIKQIIEYLLQFKDIMDCSMVFDDSHGTGVWSDPQNWYPAYNAVPKAEHAVRVDKPCNVNIENAHCSSIRLRKDGIWDGKLNILPNGGLTVMDGITEVHGTNFMTTYPSKAADLVIQANSSGRNGSLVFGNTEDDLQATVEYYSLASGAKTSSPIWQYIGIPITDKPIAIDAYHAAWMCSWESVGNVSSNWVWVENEDKIQPFKGYCITQQTAKKYTHVGSLSRPETKDLPLYYFTSPDGDGFNMFANSWVAPIDISKIEEDNFNSAAEPTIFIYNTGTRANYNTGGAPSTTGQNTGAGQFNAIPVNAAPYLDGALTKIPTMQGFFVQANKAGTLTLDYKTICFNTTTHATTAETMRAPKRRTEQIVPEVMRIDVTSANWGDRVYILMHDEFSDAFDRGWDGSKQEGDAKAPMLALVRENGLLAVAAIETAEERELSFRAGSETEYTFCFNYEGETIYLYDRLADQAVEIKTGNTYSFTAENKTAAKRFIITKNPPRIPTGIENTSDASYSDAEKCIIDGQLYIIKDNRFYDARGVRVHSFNRKEVTP